VTLKRFLLREGLWLAFVVLVTSLMRACVFGIFHVPGDEMRPTLLPGDSVVVDRLAYGFTFPFSNQAVTRWREPRNGDIVVFRDPTSDGAEHSVLVKRVVGIGGDKITIRAGRLSINGRPLEEVLLTDAEIYSRYEVLPSVARIVREAGGNSPSKASLPFSYLVQHSVTPSESSVEVRNFVVPPGRLFCLGDNRDDTAESRFWGFVDTSQVIGKAVRVAYSMPLERAPGADTFRWWRFLRPVR
jgi:signal peptidase I